MYMCVCVCIHAFSFQGGVCWIILSHSRLETAHFLAPSRKSASGAKRCRSTRLHTASSYRGSWFRM